MMRFGCEDELERDKVADDYVRISVEFRCDLDMIMLLLLNIIVDDSLSRLQLA